MKCAVVTIAIGDKYLKEYNETFRRFTENYCEKNNYDFHLITEYIYTDDKYKQPIFSNIMKWCLPFYEPLQQYDRIAIVDADIAITENCPPLESLNLNDKIGMVNENIQPSKEKREEIHRRLNYADKTASDYFLVHIDKELSTDIIFNGGLIICNPKINGPWFKKIFDNHVDGTLTAKFHPFHYEQAWLSYELITNNMYYILDNRWNIIWPLWKHVMTKNIVDEYNDKFNNSYMIHHCAGVDWDLVRSK